MREKLTVRLALVVLIVIGIILGTDWYAYHLGVRREHDRMASIVEEIDDSAEANSLDIVLQLLQLLVRHPDEIPPDRLRYWYKKTQIFADSVEKSQVAKNRRIGNDLKADRWQKKVNEARDLVEKLGPYTR